MRHVRVGLLLFVLGGMAALTWLALYVSRHRPANIITPGPLK